MHAWQPILDTLMLQRFQNLVRILLQVYNIQSMQLESSGFSLYAVERGMLGLLFTTDLCLLKLCSVSGNWGLSSVCISQATSQLEGEKQAGAASLGPWAQTMSDCLTSLWSPWVLDIKEVFSLCGVWEGLGKDMGVIFNLSDLFLDVITYWIKNSIYRRCV